MYKKNYDEKENNMKYVSDKQISDFAEKESESIIIKQNNEYKIRRTSALEKQVLANIFGGALSAIYRNLANVNHAALAAAYTAERFFPEMNTEKTVYERIRKICNAVETDVRDKDFYSNKFIRKWESCLNRCPDEKDKQAAATELFEETADADEIAGYYVVLHKNLAFQTWQENTVHLKEEGKMSPVDKKVDNILRTLYA